MRLGEKVRYLRLVEGDMRGLGREMSQQEVARATKAELGQSISQSYLSQIESGARPHLTNSTRLLLARFFKVHPGYLVDDPPGYHTELTSELRTVEAQLDRWLRQGAEQFGADPELRDALLKLAREDDSRRCLVLLGRLVDAPDLVGHLMDVLRPREERETASTSPPELGWLQ
ncbi:MAG TPA: helix-turn-helix transcriptional regulator [Vicinamibacterales bacterium]|jgi:transcriptional regulator with XRE-family HTH domain|nr:helix-turn-helix transcriptional regulator [Vicinamibacterales bacterium]